MVRTSIPSFDSNPCSLLGDDGSAESPDPEGRNVGVPGSDSELRRSLALMLGVEADRDNRNSPRRPDEDGNDLDAWEPEMGAAAEDEDGC